MQLALAGPDRDPWRESLETEQGIPDIMIDSSPFASLLPRHGVLEVRIVDRLSHGRHGSCDLVPLRPGTLPIVRSCTFYDLAHGRKVSGTERFKVSGGPGPDGEHVTVMVPSFFHDAEKADGRLNPHAVCPLTICHICLLGPISNRVT